jgi:hypothetical protein
MEAERVQAVIEALSGRRVCVDCAETFLDVLDAVRAQRRGGSQQVGPDSP